ncbi:hypothetical protein KUTeg_004923 [Tegillarca granosa]|uniref:Uncharacterized protein n=1 Tax=Tegillarca granosa TaxID=220873 RepID=A0ABQ9FI91_TEGGR|nr:hypothetical protein KUTeg_004923 [Tegillarca granosa]
MYNHESRRALKSTISVIKSSQIQSKDSWILNKCRLDTDGDGNGDDTEADNIQQVRKKIRNEDVIGDG